MKILLTYGTRPEYIKIKPLIDELKLNKISFKVLFTGQHENISGGEYDYRLTMVEYGPNRLDNIIQNCMNLPDEYFEGITHILVQGDTTSVTGLALSALHRKIPLIHLEAGLRTYDNENPFPEENNRRIVSTIASIHLCPTQLNQNNLVYEGIQGEKYVVGNTVLDGLLEHKIKCEYEDKILITMHRRENHEKINDWFTSINQLAIDYPNLEFIFPIHPNPNVQKFKGLLTNVKIVEPMNHDDLINLLVKTKLVITDSGGLQEECSFFNKKCLVCRKITERPESLNTTSFLVNEPSDLGGMFYNHLVEHKVKFDCPYGDGEASKKIVKILKEINEKN